MKREGIISDFQMWLKIQSNCDLTKEFEKKAKRDLEVNYIFQSTYDATTTKVWKLLQYVL